MGNAEQSFSVSRAHLVYGLTLPLAALLGFLLAEPLGSNLIVVMVLAAALMLPLMMRWYHPLLVITWNAVMLFPFLPGQPPWWMLITMAGFGILVLNRAVGLRAPLAVSGAVPKSLLLLVLVVVGTALLTGGAGFRTLGGSSFGGKRYIYIAAAIMGYFVLASRRIPPHRVILVVVLFFLAATTSGLSALADRWIPALGYIVPTYMDVESSAGTGLLRITGLGTLSGALCYAFLARYGVRGLLDFMRPWRFILMAGFIGVGLWSGFRSSLFAQILTIGIIFFMEGLHRSRYMVWTLGLLMLLGVATAKFSKDLPFSVQRSISFLPVEVSPMVRGDAQGSLDWRTDMWAALMPEVREHLLLGKGYLLDPGDLYMASVNAYTGFGLRSEGSAVAGDYHNGPLSLLIPFGIWGLLAFGVFLVASLRLMYRYCQQGRPEFQTVNRVLFACFLTRAFFFIFLVGAFHMDLAYLIGLVGLAVSINGEPAQPEVADEEVAVGQDFEAA